jgi:hypothetical protein
MQEWINECDFDHNCDAPRRPLPTRILDLQDSTIRLLETTGENDRYVALSHCWGNSSTFTTTQDTLESRKLGFGLNDLPQTFHDAVKLTRLLGIRYLWIDSLCIIQGDKADWRTEGSKMCEIYHGAYLTICAARASDDREGFLSKRLSKHMFVTIDRGRGATSRVYLAIDRGRPTGRSGEPENEPLNQRGWTFQERFLSGRKLTFCKEEMFWECQTHCRYEDGLNGPGTAGRTDFQTQSLQPVEAADGKVDFGGWRDAVSRYSARILTYDTDKLPALSGLASYVAQKRGNSYCAGLWMEDLPGAFFWVANRNCSRPKEWRAPSWSWASVK